MFDLNPHNSSCNTDSPNGDLYMNIKRTYKSELFKILFKIPFSDFRFKLYSLHFSIDDVLGDFFRLIIYGVLAYLGNFTFIKNYVTNYIFNIYI